MSRHTLQSRSLVAAARATVQYGFMLVLGCAFTLTASAQDVVDHIYRFTNTGTKTPIHAGIPGTLVTPASSQLVAADKGKRAHTNLGYLKPAVSFSTSQPPYFGYLYETPESLACIYKLVKQVAGCNPNLTVTNPTGGAQTIAIVDAYDDPQAASDLAYFSDQFGIPFTPEKFQVVYQSGSAPPTDSSGGWELEESLDIEYAHAMAPNATIYLVEANSNYYTDLFAAVGIAKNLVQCGKTTTCPSTSKGKGEISMSWGGEEFASETSYDASLLAPNVVFFASSGDSSGVSFPCVSPNVVCVGGTAIARSLETGDFVAEIAWSNAGSGLSYYQPIPTYQSGIAKIAGSSRAVPDVAANASSASDVWIYDSFPLDGEYQDWIIVYGTSVASPTWAGIVNSAGKFAASSAAELTTIYADLASKTAYPADFNDVTYGGCYFYTGYFAGTGYDLCTGVGTPNTYAGK
jgi:subtilase family serine protease